MELGIGLLRMGIQDYRVFWTPQVVFNYEGNFLWEERTVQNSGNRMHIALTFPTTERDGKLSYEGLLVSISLGAFLFDDTHYEERFKEKE